MKKLKSVLILLISLVVGILLYHDARTLDLDRSDLPVNDQLAITISQRYIAGFWTHPVKLHLTPYESKNVKETAETYVVNIIDERDTANCKGYRIVVEKDTGKVIDKEEADYCQ
ncbi:hypothetical protein J7I80_04535 [Bacillus sp. ISL-41]|uniref:hypothetical protein n=1 Tax=Bacillus sp. ISL-41 TaxID=2819127 RepID=UPI001BE6FC60|nr:hypothetical protein [Bacillus sp. ISL-41]MBT2641481.1 hypothetical protein [Bacillus sp. ISL-41]